jgi:transcription factor WhiB
MLTARESEILKKRERSGQMTGLPAAQPNHSLATAHAPAQVAVWPPGVPAPALVGSWAWARVIRQARCAESSLDADVWFPVSPGAQQARQEAAAAIAICKDCPVRSQCLALSLRHWDVGQHGVWGGMVAAERASLRRQMLEHRADALRYFTDAVGLPSYRSRSLIGAVQSSPLAKALSRGGRLIRLSGHRRKHLVDAVPGCGGGADGPVLLQPGPERGPVVQQPPRLVFAGVDPGA